MERGCSRSLFHALFTQSLAQYYSNRLIGRNSINKKICQVPPSIIDKQEVSNDIYHAAEMSGLCFF